MSSIKRYWDVPFTFQGETRVLSEKEYQGKPAFVLESSLFYPEGGGQLGDRGSVSFGNETREVIDTQTNEKGEIFIILETSFSTSLAGQVLALSVNEEFRRRQMSQHTGQHLLSRLLHDRYEAVTVSARLGEQYFSIDLETSGLSSIQLAQAEEEINTLILEDHPIRAWFPSPEELLQLPLRKQPGAYERIRVIQVEGFDVTPCGGTHCVRTGQVGLIHIQSVEKCKQLTRIIVSAGLDLVRDFREKEDIFQKALSLFSATPTTLITNIEALRVQQLELQASLKERTKALAEARAEQNSSMVEGGLVLVHVEESDLEYVRAFSKALAKKHRVTSLVTTNIPEGIFMVLDRSEKGPIDIGLALKEVLTQSGGKGGGGPLHAEGRAADLGIIDILKGRLNQAGD